MSDDPYLYNDQLLNSTSLPVGWSDVPVMIQKEVLSTVFEPFGVLRKVRYSLTKNLFEVQNITFNIP